MASWIHCKGRSQGKRLYQEDDYGVFELPASLAAGELLLVLADGMGGAQAGDRASAAVVRSFIDAYAAVPSKEIPARLRRALDHANRELALEVAGDQLALTGMGCTALAVVLAKRELYWISVGDSPLWLWRRGHLTRLNEDHSYRKILAEQVAVGELNPQEAALHPNRNALLSAVTGDRLVLVDLCEQACSLQADDRVLLASDGLLTLSEADIAAHLGDEMAAELPCQRLLAAVAAAGYPNQDNTTVIVVQQGARTRWNVSTWVLLAGLLLGAVLLVMSWLWHWGTSL